MDYLEELDISIDSYNGKPYTLIRTEQVNRGNKADTLIQNFIGQANETSVAESAIPQFIEQLEAVYQKEVPTSKQVKDVIYILFAHFTECCMSPEGEELKSYFFNERVTNFVQTLVKGTQGSTVVLKGLVDTQLKFIKTPKRLWDLKDEPSPTACVYRYKGKGIYPAPNQRRVQRSRTKWSLPIARINPVRQVAATPNQYTNTNPAEVAAASVDLLLRWFLDDQSNWVITQPGGTQALFEILDNWYQNQQVPEQIDIKLTPFLEKLISSETIDSLRDIEGGPLFQSTLILKMPALTEALLLKHPDVTKLCAFSPASMIENLLNQLLKANNLERVKAIANIVTQLTNYYFAKASIEMQIIATMLKWSGQLEPWLRSYFINFGDDSSVIENTKLTILQIMHDISTRKSFDWHLLPTLTDLCIQMGQLGMHDVNTPHGIQNDQENDICQRHQQIFLVLFERLLAMCGTEKDFYYFSTVNAIIDALNTTLWRAMINSPVCDPVKQDTSGNTLLHMLVEKVKELSVEHHSILLYMLSNLLKHPNINVAVKNKEGDTVIDKICQLYLDPDAELEFAEMGYTYENIEDRPKLEYPIILLFNLIVRHPTMNSEMIIHCLEFLMQAEIETQSFKQPLSDAEGYWSATTRHRETMRHIAQEKSIWRVKNQKVKSQTESKDNKYTDIVRFLCNHSKFDINQKTDEGSTIGQIAAKNGKLVAMEIITSNKEYNPRIADRDGYTALFYIFQYLPIEWVAKLVNKLPWDFSHRNLIGENIYEYIENAETNASKSRLLCLCRKNMPQQNQALAQPCPQPPRTPVERSPREVSLFPLPSDTRQASVVKPSDQSTVQIIYGSPQKIYELKRARKGKACIISNHTFDVPWLKRLEGYTYDKDQLKVLWDHMGFEVYYPACEESDSVLTAQEMESAVARFAEELNGDDDCAILCILSHGGEGFVYGSDGKQVKIADLMKYLDNHHCLAMVGKPKVVIIQACNGDRLDTGTCQTAGPCLAEPAADAEKNPFISDMIICSPSMPGYVSYVYNTPGQGSVFIKTLVETVQEYAGAEDIYDLHTRINHKIAETTISVKKPDGSIGDYKQMSRFESSLRKRLYFLPCPGGKQGNDWN